MTRPVAAMILAAGRGERMRPLTDAVPKPLLVARGRPLIEWHVEALVAAGITRLVINLAWLGDQIRTHLGDGARYGASIQYSDERASALETAGGIIHALPHLQPGPFAVVNGDVYTDYAFGALQLPADADAHLVLVPTPAYLKSGDFGLENRRVLPEAGVKYTFSGMAAYRTALFEGLREGVRPLKPLLVGAMQAGRCSGELFRGRWDDIGTPERLAALNQEP